jgi:hypothetical protein
MAFSKESRQEMLERAEYKSELDGSTGRLEACHFSHDKRAEYYDDPYNGIVLTIEQHKWQHEQAARLAKEVAFQYPEGSQEFNRYIGVQRFHEQSARLIKGRI